MKKYILLIGAYERDNLGDILFAKIYEKLFDKYLVVKTGLVGRDLTTIGGDLVVSPINFLNNYQEVPVAIIHCGGETITLPKRSGISMNLPYKVITNDYFKKAEPVIAGSLSQSAGPIAYLYNHKDLGLGSTSGRKVPVAFNSVGGTALKKYKRKSSYVKEIGKRLKGAKFISVRDKTTQENIKEYFRLKTNLHADIVSLLPLTHKKEIELAGNKPAIADFVAKKDYFLVQISSKILEEYGDDVFANEIVKLFSKYKKRFVFQPFGLASGHGSLEKLNQLRNKVLAINSKIETFVHTERNVWDEVAIAANAFCAIGTSLHLRIICSVFLRPCVSLVNQKVTSYAETWKIDKNPYNATPDTLIEKVDVALNITTRERLGASNLLVADSLAGIRQLAKSLKLTLNDDNFSSLGNKKNLTESHFTALSDELEDIRVKLAEEILKTVALDHDLMRIKNTRGWRMLMLFRPVYSLYKKIKDAKNNL